MASYYAHSGMLNAAKQLKAERGIVHDTLKVALQDYPDYGRECGKTVWAVNSSLLTLWLAIRSGSHWPQVRSWRHSHSGHGTADIVLQPGRRRRSVTVYAVGVSFGSVLAYRRLALHALHARLCVRHQPIFRSPSGATAALLCVWR